MHTRTVLTFCTAVVIGGALLTGSAFGRAEERNMSDSWITAKTKIALFADSRVKGSDINVATTDGAVIIRGKVDTDAAKQAAEGIAKGIEGAKTVKNDLQVVAPTKREAVDDKDDVKQNADGSWTIKSGARVRVRLTMVAQARRYHDLSESH